MKKLLSLLLTVVLGLGVLPVSALALETNDAEFNQFLDEIGWDKEDYLNYLKSKDWTLDDFESIDDLGTPLTEKSVQSVLDEFGLNREELNDLLIENGDLEAGQDVLDGGYLIFEEELSEFIDYYLNFPAGTPIDEENLQQLLNDYGFKSKEELEQFLQENGDSLENYEYIEDLEIAVDYYVNGDEYLEDISGLFTELGLTEGELDHLFAHLETLDIENPAFEEKLLELSERMMAFEDFDTATELSAGQIAELLDIFSDMLDLFQLDTKYYLVKDGKKQAITLSALMNMDTADEFDLLMEIYNKQGKFLADILITADMFGSEIINDTGEDLKEAEQIIAEKPKVKTNPKVKAKPPAKTVKGAKLPKTASDYAGNSLAGLGLVLAGAILFWRIRKVRGN